MAKDKMKEKAKEKPKEKEKVDGLAIFSRSNRSRHSDMRRYTRDVEAKGDLPLIETQTIS
jgi:hypothetical protein